MGCVSKGLATGWWLTWRASDGVIRGGICALHAMKASLSCSTAALAVGQTGTDALRTAETGCTAPCCPRTGLTVDSGCSSSAKHCGKRSFQEARGQVGTQCTASRSSISKNTTLLPPLLFWLFFSGPPALCPRDGGRGEPKQRTAYF